MEEILELILTVICAPFEGLYDRLLASVNRKENKFFRFLLKGAVILVPILLILGLTSLCSYLFRGYWI